MLADALIVLLLAGLVTALVMRKPPPAPAPKNSVTIFNRPPPVERDEVIMGVEGQILHQLQNQCVEDGFDWSIKPTSNDVPPHELTKHVLDSLCRLANRDDDFEFFVSIIPYASSSVYTDGTQLLDIVAHVHERTRLTNVRIRVLAVCNKTTEEPLFLRVTFDEFDTDDRDRPLYRRTGDCLPCAYELNAARLGYFEPSEAANYM